MYASCRSTSLLDFSSSDFSSSVNGSEILRQWQREPNDQRKHIKHRSLLVVELLVAYMALCPALDSVSLRASFDQSSAFPRSAIFVCIEAELKRIFLAVKSR